jgi:hypothetical protein
MSRALRLTAAALLVIAAVSCSLFDALPGAGSRYALVYGITRYTMGALPDANPNLRYPDADASGMAALLASRGYTVRSRWVDGSGMVYRDGSAAGTVGSPTATGNPVVITDGGSSAEAPTKDVIEQDIRDLAVQAGPNDTVVIYFSGHGMMDTYSPPSSHQWIIPYQGVAWFPGQGAYLGYPDTSIRDNELTDLLASVPTRKVMLLLDTCNSGGFIGNAIDVDVIPPVYTGSTPAVTAVVLKAAMDNYASAAASLTGLAPTTASVLAAAGRDEASYEADAPYAHGIMTYYLLKAADSADLNKDGVVTLLETYAFVKAGIDADWNSDSGVRNAGETFAPHVSGGPVDFVLF